MTNDHACWPATLQTATAFTPTHKLSFVFLSDARRLELSPCNKQTCHCMAALALTCYPGFAPRRDPFRPPLLQLVQLPHACMRQAVHVSMTVLCCAACSDCYDAPRGSGRPAPLHAKERASITLLASISSQWRIGRHKPASPPPRERILHALS